MNDRCFEITAAVLLSLAGAASTVEAQPPSGPLSAADLFRQCSPAIVTIQTSSKLGSGVVIDRAGLIVTNLHVIQGESQARLTLASGDTFDDVQVVDVDARKDLVVLRVKTTTLRAVALADSDAVAVGHTVYAIGTPKGLERTLSQGLISGVREIGGVRVLQTSAAISPGSSGGGLFNERGELIGITTFQAKGGENLNFAIPVNYARPLTKATTTTTLAMLAQKYPAEPTEHAQHAEGVSGDSPPAQHNGPVPALGQTYVALSGNVVTFEQDGVKLSATWATQKGDVYGRTAFIWDANSRSFMGTGTLSTICGGTDGQTLHVAVKEEITILDAKTIRDRWTKPVRVNCVKGEVESFAWDEMLWYAAQK